MFKRKSTRIIGVYKFQGAPPTLALYASLTELQARVLELSAPDATPLEYLKFCYLGDAKPAHRWTIVYQKPL